MTDRVVVDASAIVYFLLGSDVGSSVRRRLAGCRMDAPTHLDAEVLSALGRMQRAKELSTRVVTTRLRHLAEAPIERHPLPPLLVGAWRRRDDIRLVDGLYVELSEQLDAPLVTTDARLAAATERGELIGEP